MKYILDTFKWVNKNPENYFETNLIENGKPKILFIKPQLIAKDVYRYIFPYLILHQYRVANVAFTEIGNFKSKNNSEVEMPITSKQIKWADFIVFPFTIQPLKELYDQIKAINPNARTIFNLDYNFYELLNSNPFYKICEPKKVKSDIESNMLYADSIMVSNGKMVDYLSKKLPEINKIGKKVFDVITMPYTIDYSLVMENVDVSQEPSSPKNGKIRIGIIATENNWEDLNNYREEIKEIHKRHKDKVQFVMIGFNGTDKRSMKTPFTGITNYEVKVNEKGGAVGITNFFKCLYNANLDAVWVPIRKNVFNETSDNYNRFLEAALFKCPVITFHTFPYNQVIKDKETGFLFSKKSDFLLLIDAFVKRPEALKLAGEKAHEAVNTQFGFTESAARVLQQIFVLEEVPAQ